MDTGTLWLQQGGCVGVGTLFGFPHPRALPPERWISSAHNQMSVLYGCSGRVAVLLEGSTNT